MSEYPHFRKYTKSKHPALIVGSAKIEKQDDGYLYRKTSHSSKMSKKSEKVYPNPNPKDPKPMYIEKRKRADYRNKFGPKLPWKFPQKNKQEVPRDPRK